MNKYIILSLGLIAAQVGFGQVTLPTSTTPSNGVAGVTNVNITANNVPGTPTAANIIVSFESTCGGAAVQSSVANSVRAILTIDRINFNIPAGLATGTYYVQISDTADPTHFTSTDCSSVQVQGSTSGTNSCVAGSSMAVLLPPGGATGTVTAYVPKGYWTGSTTGVFVKNIEGTLGTGTTIATPNIANSCSSNPATGQTVCVANNTDVYLITGTTLTNKLTSGSNTTTDFSGGSCNNCGVTVDALHNLAFINMGVTGGASYSGLQILNLNNNTFSAPAPFNEEVSENISVDPLRTLVFTADEDGNYVVGQFNATTNAITEFDPTFNSGVEDDSSAEDCSTGVAIAPGEFTNSVQMVNLNGLTPLTTSPYTAPNTLVTLSTNYSFSAGLSGSAVAQGSGHLAVVTGEFGGNTFAVLQLPATPNTAVPTLVDYAVAAIPSSSACGSTFSAGFDPHTITAYTSPNDNNSYALFAGYSGSVPVCLAKVNMNAVLAATRGGTGYQAHDVSPANLPASAVTFFSLP